METLVIPRACWSQMVTQAEKASPEECCGLAGGREGAVSEAVAVENALHSPFEFRMDASAQVKAMLQMEEAGLDLLAIYHSHPQGPEIPSEKDIKQFMYPQSYSIILSRKNKGWKGRGFRIRNGTVEEIELLIR